MWVYAQQTFRALHTVLNEREVCKIPELILQLNVKTVLSGLPSFKHVANG